MGFPVGDAATTAGVVAELLEYAASDDVNNFVLSASRDPVAIHATGFWYGRCPVSSRMGLLHRTPLMVAAAYASLEVLQLILSLTAADDVDFRCGAESFTALHCAASGGATAAPLAVVLLLAAGADNNAVDAFGRRPVDVIPTAAIMSSLRSALEGVLGNVSPPLSPSSSSASSSPTKKKNYPIDRSIPDIQSSMYSSDEFRMFTFKVKPCSRAYSHDWTECPFLHPGENARRRDPRRFQYSCTPCAEFRHGQCPKGDLCGYAHGVFECWLHPAQYRTRLCKDGNSCTRRVCFFAHSANDLRSLPIPIAHRLARTPCISEVEVHSPFLASTATNCTSPKFKSDYYTTSLSPTSRNYNHWKLPPLQQNILSPTAVNSLHCVPPLPGMSLRIGDGGIRDGVMVRTPSSFRRHSFSVEREKLEPQFQKHQIRSSFGWNSPAEQVGEELDLSWIQTLVGRSKGDNGGCLFGEKALSSTIDEEHAILKDWLEQMQLDNKPAL